MESDILDEFDDERLEKLYGPHTPHSVAAPDGAPTQGGPGFARSAVTDALRPGRKIHHVTVTGRARRPEVGPPGNREYEIQCVCGRLFWAPRSRLYYGSVWSCGCRERKKHPNVRLEETDVGSLHVLLWDEEEGHWLACCRECGQLVSGASLPELRRIAEARCGDHGKARI